MANITQRPTEGLFELESVGPILEGNHIIYRITVRVDDETFRQRIVHNANVEGPFPFSGRIAPLSGSPSRDPRRIVIAGTWQPPFKPAQSIK